MKSKFIGISVLIALLCLSADAGQILFVPAPVEAPVEDCTCSDTPLINITSTAVTYGTGAADSTYYTGETYYDETNTRLLCKITAEHRNNTGDTSAKTVTYRVWELDGTALSTEVGASEGKTGVNSYATYTWSAGDLTNGIELTAGVNYAITVDQGEVDASNNLRVYGIGSDTHSYGQSSQWALADGSRTNTDATRDLNMRLYFCE